MTSAALAIEEEARPFELTVVEPEQAAEPGGSLRTRLALTLIVVVQVAWLAALGYAVLAFA